MDCGLVRIYVHLYAEILKILKAEHSLYNLRCDKQISI